MPSTLIHPRNRAKNADKLTDAERIFCAEYMANGMKGTDACRVAYPKNKNPGPTVGKLLLRPRVNSYLGKLLKGKLDQAGLSTDRLLKKLETVLFFDPMKVFDSLGNGVFQIKSLEEVPEEIRCCITKIKCKTRKIQVKDGEPIEETYIELEFQSRDKALEMAMKYRGLLEPDKKEQHLHLHGAIDLDKLCGRVEEADVVEGRIASVGEKK